MTIEERLLHDYGATTDPVMATWMLKDGTLVNGTYEGRQRDVDHRCVSEYFSRSKFETPGSAFLYVKKFMRRGNVRVCCHDTCRYFEHYSPLSDEQIQAILPMLLDASEQGIENGVGRHRGRVSEIREISRMGLYQFVQHLERYVYPDDYEDRLYRIDRRVIDYI